MPENNDGVISECNIPCKKTEEILTTTEFM